ncbi:carboxypeptidase Q [Sigmodon hispidus]
MKFLFFMIVGVLHLVFPGSGKALYKNGISQRTFQEIKTEIASYEDVAKAIINLAVYGKYQNRSYERLGLLVDTVGPRLSGSKNLEKAIQIMYQNLQQDSLENVHLEPVRIPHWERGEESAVMLLPRIHKMAILGLGSSIGTPPGGITAEVLVVTSFDELQRRASEARGKIIVYNQPYTSYEITVQYRVQGAVEAAKLGAVASLIRSVASFSIYSPHTGIQKYQDGVPKIPTACITVEDAEMMSRMASRGNKILIHLEMGAKTYQDTDSFNTVAEITGSKYPEQSVSQHTLEQAEINSACHGPPPPAAVEGINKATHFQLSKEIRIGDPERQTRSPPTGEFQNQVLYAVHVPEHSGAGGDKVCLSWSPQLLLREFAGLAPCLQLVKKRKIEDLKFSPLHSAEVVIEQTFFSEVTGDTLARVPQLTRSHLIMNR